MDAIRCALCGFEVRYLTTTPVELREREVLVRADKLMLGSVMQGYRHAAAGVVVCKACPDDVGSVVQALHNAMKTQ